MTSTKCYTRFLLVLNIPFSPIREEINVQFRKLSGECLSLEQKAHY